MPTIELTEEWAKRLANVTAENVRGICWRVADLIIRAEGGHWEPHDWEGISEPGAPEQTAKCRGCGKVRRNRAWEKGGSDETI
jgi:hypothetical protein